MDLFCFQAGGRRRRQMFTIYVCVEINDIHSVILSRENAIGVTVAKVQLHKAWLTLTVGC